MKTKRKIEQERMRINHHQLTQHFHYEELTGRELARLAGVSHATIQNYLNGESKTCNPSTAKRIEKALKVPKMTIFVSEPTSVDSTRRAA